MLPGEALLTQALLDGWEEETLFIRPAVPEQLRNPSDMGTRWGKASQQLSPRRMKR